MKTTYSIHTTNGPMFGDFSTLSDALEIYADVMALHDEDAGLYDAPWIVEETTTSRKVSALEIEEERG